MRVFPSSAARRLIPGSVPAAVLALSSFAISLFASPASGQSTPTIVPLCDVLRNPASFEGQKITVRGSIILAFEEFSMYSQDCSIDARVWLMFGGDVATPTMSTVNDTSRVAGTDPLFGGTRYGLKKDENFRKFYALITSRRDGKPAYRVTATLTGTFFAATHNRQEWRGYGHLGCCHLFIISAVSDIESIPPALATVTGSVVSSAGVPLVDVRVVNEAGSCCQVQSWQSVTDAAGRFTISNPGQILYFQSPAYRPQALVLDGTKSEFRVELEDSGQAEWTVPDCDNPQFTQPGKRAGFIYKVLIPAGSKAQKPSANFPQYIISRSRKRRIDFLRIFPETASSSFNDASFRLANATSWSQRWIKNSSGQIIGLDSAGAMAERGWLWRVVTFHNEGGMSFATQSEDNAKYFNAIINSACSSRY